MPRSKPAPDARTTYLIGLTHGGVRKITVPSNWKVTFGPAVPPSPGARVQAERGYALRFYETEKQQRAIFTDVAWFRDAALAVEERVTKTKAQRMTKHTANGAKDVVVEASVTEWINPDNPPEPEQEFLRLAGPSGDDF